LFEAADMIAEIAQMIDFEDALRIVRREARPLQPETVPLGQTLGRVLAKPVATTCDLPPFDNSAVDGYAVCPADVRAGVARRKFLVLGELPAGDPAACRLEPGETVRVFTGGPLPDNTGSIVMQEHANPEGEYVRLDADCKLGDHIRARGEEAVAGDEFVQPGLITPAVIAALAMAGAAGAEVVSRPRVGILVTGNELIAPVTRLGEGQTYECNGPALAGAIRTLGLAEPTVLRAADSMESTLTALEKLVDSCDVVISSGGVSVGEYDLVRRALNQMGAREYFWRVAMKPGKPVYFGRLRGTAIFGLPGNPVSALITYLLLVRPFLRGLCGVSTEDTSRRMPVTESMSKKSGRVEFVPCVVDAEFARPVVGRASHKASCLAEANGLVILPKEMEAIEAGEVADVLEIRWGLES